MKKLFLILFLALFLTSFASAELLDSKIDFKDKTSYTLGDKIIPYNILWEKYQPIEIKALFGLGTTKWKGAITEHTETCGTDCFSIMQIELVSDGTLIDDIIFYTILEDGNLVEQPIRNYNFEIETKGKQIEVIDYKNICKDTSFYENGTNIQECSVEIAGSHLEDSPEWTIYNMGSIVPSGVYTLRLYGEKKPSRTVDWVIKTKGETLNEWATWGNISTGSQAEVILNSPSNGEILYSNNVGFNATINITGGATLTNMSLWTNESGSWAEYNITLIPSSNESHGKALSGGNSATGKCGIKIQANENSVIMNITKGSGTAATKAYLLNSTLSVLVTSGTFSGNNAIFSTPAQIVKGTYYYLAVDAEGASFNCESSNQDVGYPTAKTNFNWTGTPIYNGATPAPADDTRYYGVTGAFTTLSSKIQTWNRTITSPIIWNVEACDSDGDCGFAPSNYTFTMDSIPPTITITSPSGIYNYLYQNYNLTLNITATDTNLQTCIWNYNGTNTTTPCTSGLLNTSYFNYSKDVNSGIFYVNDSLGNTNSSNISWNYKIFENNRTINSTSFDTATESYLINITANSSLTNVYLNYSDTIYATTQSGTVWSQSHEIPTSKVGNNLVNFIMTYAGTNSSSTYSYQNVTSTVFSLCNATYSIPFLNISFKDEADLSTINATIPTSTFTYYLGDGTISKNLTYVDNTANYNYTFCSNVGSRNLNVDPTVQYKQGTDYPQRIWTPELQIYNSSFKNQTLYLLSSIDGIYVTYQVLDSIGGKLQGVDVTAVRTISGNSITVGVGQTDSAGLVTLWLNPDFVHALTFSKTGYTSYSLDQFPTQSSYTVTLSGGSSDGITDYLRGIIWNIKPILGTTLPANTNIYFNFTVNSSYWTLDSFGFSLYGDDVLVGANSSTENYGTLTNLLNTSNYTNLIINYYWIINGTLTNSSSGGWFIYDYNEGTDWSINTFFTDLKTYATPGADGHGIFGLTQNSLNFIIFMIIFISVGIVSYKFGLTSPSIISGVVFGLVFLFDYALGMLDIGIGGALEHLPTFFVGLVTVALIVKETTE